MAAIITASRRVFARVFVRLSHRINPMNTQTTTSPATLADAQPVTASTIILCESRGDYLTGLRWESDGTPEIMGGDRQDAIRYTLAEAGELLASLGRGFSAEPEQEPAQESDAQPVAAVIGGPRALAWLAKKEAELGISQPVTAVLLWPTLEALGMHAEPYPGGGIQAFIGRADIAQPELYRSLWNLADAHVVGTLSGPALHIMPKAK
jgi:hypothetical protein